jgi:ribosomal protein S14
MTIDEELLEQARAARHELEKIEEQANKSKLAYHSLIRQLSVSGASLREIARELSISHQRVQQVVESQGGSWWSRVWSTRSASGEFRCTFCGRSRDVATQLVAGPRVFICNACVVTASKALAKGRAKSGKHELSAAPSGSRARCTFCGGRHGGDRVVIMGEEASICSACLELAEQIMRKRAG